MTVRGIKTIALIVATGICIYPLIVMRVEEMNSPLIENLKRIACSMGLHDEEERARIPEGEELFDFPCSQTFRDFFMGIEPDKPQRVIHEHRRIITYFDPMALDHERRLSGVENFLKQKKQVDIKRPF